MSSGVAEVVTTVSEVEPSLAQKARDYVALMKPRIVLLFGVTGLASMLLEGSLHGPRHIVLWAVFAGMVLVAGSANALNQYWDRDIDAVMERTRKKRPLPAGRLSPNRALFFGITTGILGVWVLYEFGNALSAFFGVFTIVYYVGLYTIWLKRRTPYNIVIGGAAGATAPLIGWAAAAGEVSAAAWLLFLVIFFWTPAHFWALALCVKEEYAQVAVPMLPVVAGEPKTRRQIFYYTLATVPLSLALAWVSPVGWIYMGSAIALGAVFMWYAWTVLRGTEKKLAWRMFGYSIFYLLALFVALMVDVKFQ